MTKVYTKTGDKGTTGLFGGTRIGKDSLRVETYGSIDTANASIGVARSHIHNKTYHDLLKTCQLQLFEIAALIASDEKGLELLNSSIGKKDVEYLEASIDILSQDLSERNYFSVPGKSKQSSFLHQARVDVRQAERRLIALSHQEKVAEILIQYMNRLSDLMYTLSRVVDEVHQINDPVEAKLSTKMLLRARDIERACIEKAKEIGVPMAIAISDKHGEIVSFGVMDETMDVSYSLAKDKAYTSAVIRMETSELGMLTQPGQSLYGLENKKHIVVFGGGIPLFSHGKIIGAIGVSGGSVEEDIQVAKAGEAEFLRGNMD